MRRREDRGLDNGGDEKSEAKGAIRGYGHERRRHDEGDHVSAKDHTSA